MGQAIAFDTLAFANKLKSAGVPEKQAEVQAAAIAEIVNEQMATKRDLKEMETGLKRDIKELEMRLTIRMGAMTVVAIGVITTLVKIL